jgi:hypothetical protein
MSEIITMAAWQQVAIQIGDKPHIELMWGLFLSAVSEQQIVNLLLFSLCLELKTKPAGRVPPDAILFVQAATKRMQKRPCSLRRATPLPDFSIDIPNYNGKICCNRAKFFIFTS